MKTLSASMLLATSLLMGSATAPVSLIQNEYDFAAAVAKDGLRDGFLMYLDKQAMTLNPKPVNDYQRYEKARPGTDGVKLTWYPVWALLSASGDFGVDTGPWTYAATGKDGKPETACGDWFTVWARDKEGRWRALFDAGIDHGTPVATPEALAHDTVVPQLKALESPALVAAAQDQLMRAEEAFSNHAVKEGMRAAYQELGSDDLRLLQEGHEPVLGKSAVMQNLGTQASDLVWISSGGSVARSGDLGYLYGLTFAAADKRTQRDPLGSFLHVWQRTAEGWKLLVIVDTPIPPAR